MSHPFVYARSVSKINVTYIYSEHQSTGMLGRIKRQECDPKTAFIMATTEDIRSWMKDSPEIYNGIVEINKEEQGEATDQRAHSGLRYDWLYLDVAGIRHEVVRREDRRPRGVQADARSCQREDTRRQQPQSVLCAGQARTKKVVKDGTRKLTEERILLSRLDALGFEW